MQYREAVRLRTEVAELTKERDRLRERSRRSTARVATAPQNAGADFSENAATGAVEVEAAASGNIAVASPANVVRATGGRFNPMNSPEVQQLMAIQQKAALDGRYAALFRRLNLSPAALEQLKQLLVEKQAVVMDVMTAARSQGMGGRNNRDEIRQVVASTQAEVEASIRAAIGDAAYEQYRNYEVTLPQRGLVDQLSQRLSYSNSPLGDAQAEQMVRILAATAPNGQAGNAGNAGAVLMPMVINSGRGGTANVVMGGSVAITDAAIAQARGVLTPQQVSALETLQQEQRAAAALMEQMRTNRQNQRAGAAVPASPGGG